MPLAPAVDLAPDFTVNDVSGTPFTLSAQRGKVMVLVLNRGFA